MLHHLKNSEIYPYFWNCYQAPETLQSFQFLDLRALQKQWPENDEALEKVLYGTYDEPHFSGWTLTRLVSILPHCGFEIPKFTETKGIMTVTAAERKPWARIAQMAARLKRLEQQTWFLRKNLRQKYQETQTRLEKKIQPQKLPSQNLWLNLGAGAENYKGYFKVDLNGAQDVYDNITTLRKIDNNSVERIYTNHVLEHIAPTQIDMLLKRWHEVLQPGGEVVARIPDARQAVLTLGGTWVEATSTELKQYHLPDFLAKEPALAGTLDDQTCIQLVYGWSDSTPHGWDAVNQHKSLWTPQLAHQRFERAGFDVEVAQHLGTLNTLVIARKKK